MWCGVERGTGRERRLLYRSVGLVGEEVNGNETTITGTITSPYNEQTNPSNHHVGHAVTASTVFSCFLKTLKTVQQRNSSLITRHTQGQFTMENYHKRAKTSKPRFEDDIQDVTTTSKKHQQQQKQTTQQHNRPQQYGVMVITPNGKIRTYVSRALEVLTEADSTPIVAAAGAGAAEGSEEAGSKRSDTKSGAATSQVIFLIGY